MGTDFNGDGRDDILWRDVSNGVVSNWLGTPKGGFVVNDELALDPWAHGTLAAIGDFNGDGRDDTLWRSDGTELFVGFTDPGGAFNFYWNLGFVPPEVPISWQVVGAGMLRGIHDTRVPMVFALFGYWAIGLGVGVSLAFAMDWRGVGIWTGLAAGLGVVAVLMLWRWSRRDKLGLLPVAL